MEESKTRKKQWFWVRNIREFGEPRLKVKVFYLEKTQNPDERIALRLKNEWQLGVECQVGNKQQPLRNGGCCVFFLVFTLFYIFYYYYYLLFDYLILKTSKVTQCVGFTWKQAVVAKDLLNNILSY